MNNGRKQPQLTRRQAQLAALLLQGKTPQQAASEIGITTQSVYEMRLRIIARGVQLPSLPSQQGAQAESA